MDVRLEYRPCTCSAYVQDPIITKNEDNELTAVGKVHLTGTSHFDFIRNSSKLAPGRYFVSKWTPFMKPAFEKTKAKYLNMLTISTNRALAN